MRYFIPVVIIIEFILFRLLVNRVFDIPTSLGKSFLIVLGANIVTSLIGIFIPIADFSFNLFVFLFAGTLVIEWLFFVLFFWKANVKRLNLLYISIIINFASYLLLYVVFRFFAYT